ncbi:MAG: ABC transporter permease [Promethearchaeota archaeon]|nr:MAG: ABC transporter permease [Candidatus Lokiarchaeota archaeon]
MEKILKNFIFILIFTLALFLFALVLSFTISRFLPGDPALAYLPEGPIDWDEYEAIMDQLGYNDPLIIQFFTYAFKMILGDWGASFSIIRGYPVQLLVTEALLNSLDLLIVPLIIGLILGVFLGRISIKNSSLRSNRIVQILSLLGLALPVFLVGILIQFIFGYLLPILPLSGYKSLGLDDPPLITGSRIIDSFLSGKFYLIPDYFYHLILPWITLTISITIFIIILVRVYHINHLKPSKDIEKDSIVPFIFQVGFSFGTIFAFLMITEAIFNLNGLSHLLFLAINNADYWTIVAILYVISMSFVLIIFIFTILFIIYRIYQRQSVSKLSNINQMDKEVKL